MADQPENDQADIRKLLASIGFSAGESITVADEPPKEIDEINQILMSIGAKAHPYSKAVLPLACPDDANAQAAIARIREIGKSGDSMVKVMAASVLSDLTGDRSLLLDVLNSSLQNPDETVRMLATSMIGDFGSAAARAVPRLVEMLRGHGSTVHVSLALSEIGPAAVPHLLAALDTADPGKFAEILMILCEMIPAEQSCIDAFLRGLCHPDAQVRYQSIMLINRRGLGEFFDIETVTSKLADGDPATRQEVATFLRESRFPSELRLPRLVERLKDDDPIVRKIAVLAIGELDARARPALMDVTEMQEDPNYYVREAAGKALDRILHALVHQARSAL